ncbi:TolC family protein [Algoriphagus sanaruensis]|uniref:Transporter n=1 Tax=Algoriphagus sanaruensis TaxID=1727163 RepID=A0A142ENW7_9BACT|nr:TolC family protein [Algoriphagus sanaruensis]AMQ56822.1 transporter [Algoriphagus sanaruensis]
MKRFVIFFLVLWNASPIWAQDSLRLGFDDFLLWVKDNHPISAQAEINLTMGRMEVRQARGGFDPLIYGNLDQKEFKGTNYYDKREAGVTIPTWMGVEFNGTFEQNNGTYLNAEGTVPNGGLIAAGASVNLGQGLILDDRRATLRKAQIYQQATEVERANMLNQLYLDATDAYWKWSLAFENLKVLQEGVKLAEFRFGAIRKTYQQGDNAAIDTVEAYSQLLNRQYRLQNAQNAFFVARQNLNTFLWDDSSGNPMELNEGVIPDGLFESFTWVPNEEELRTLIANHPELRIKDFDLASLEIDRKLKSQQLLPVVKLKYNFINERFSDLNQYAFFENNYKWGVSVYTPVFLRKSRGAIGLAKAKIDFKQSDRDLKEIQLRYKLESELNSWMILNQQIETFKKNVASLDALFQGETRRFQIGESSLFLVNAREVSLFDSRLTLNDLASKLRVSYAKTRVAAGLGFE